ADITVLPDTPTTTVTSAASCSGQSCLTGLYAADNSHTTACGTTSTNLCVTVSPTACALDCSSDCSAANAATVLNRFSSSNAHISDATDTVYTDPVCCSLSTGCSFTLDTCTIKDSCATDEMELAGAYQDSNSHLSAQDTDKSICCSLKSQPQLTLVEVKQIAGGHIITYNKNFPGEASLFQISGGTRTLVSNTPLNQEGIYATQQLTDLTTSTGQLQICAGSICSPPISPV
ncbi:MAG: hypothetical protein QF535_19565, partial [Anaerolineales bacterium]|nr:hypothetical protein [Anaerolineales bacterium]